MYREDGIEEYFQEINRFPLLNREKEREVILKMKQGDEASRSYLIGCNLRLVVSIAKTYVGRGHTLLDLIAEGNLGLIKAASHFRLEEGCRFSTYGTWWIHQSIKRALVDTAKPVRIPSYLAPKIARWKRMAAKMTMLLNRQPSLHELAEACDIDQERFPIFQSAISTSNSISQTVSLMAPTRSRSWTAWSATRPAARTTSSSPAGRSSTSTACSRSCRSATRTSSACATGSTGRTR